jgi:deoxycytidine triphosphate deaminase
VSESTALRGNGVERDMWVDPDRVVSAGVLLSDRIQYYSNRVGLIEPFSPTRLGPASYDLTLGQECWYADHTEATGEPKRVLAPGERLVLEPNSIVYVSSAETLTLPFYVTGRFNLKLRLLHEGVLVGAGPQIDPGFAGRLSCPLHNLSSSRVSLTCGEPFAVLEFQKTTPFAESQTWSDGATIDDVRRAGESGKLKGVAGFVCFTFPTKSLNREPVKRYIRTGLVKSSLQGLSHKVAAVDDLVEGQLTEFRTQLKTVNVLAFVAVVTVAISMGTYFVGISNWYRELNENTIQAIERLRQLDEERTALVTQVENLEREVAELKQTQLASIPAQDGAKPSPAVPGVSKMTAPAADTGQIDE